MPINADLREAINICSLTDYQPHREILPVRRCEDCGCLLASDNATDTCSPCDPGPLVVPLWMATEDLMAANGVTA